MVNYWIISTRYIGVIVTNTFNSNTWKVVDDWDVIGLQYGILKYCKHGLLGILYTLPLNTMGLLRHVVGI